MNRVLSAIAMAGFVCLIPASLTWSGESGSPAKSPSGGKPGVEARLQRLEDESEIRRKLQDYMVLLRNRDWDNYVLMFSKDADIVMDEGTRHGREDIKNRMAGAS